MKRDDDKDYEKHFQSQPLYSNKVYMSEADVIMYRQQAFDWMVKWQEALDNIN